jgi:formamidopyrimidine-DNA glycosylase
MPELPEVETVKRQIESSGILNRNILSCAVYNSSSVGGNVADFQKQIIYSKIFSITRRGKYIIFHLASGMFLVAHLRMSGHFYVKDSFDVRQAHEHLAIMFDNGLWLIFHDPRKFGRILLVNDPTSFLQHLGLEPLSADYTWDRFQELFSSSRKIKAMLLDQSCLAGLGNIYVDETLFSCGIHPLRACNDLNIDEIRKLYDEIPKQLLQGIQFQGTSLGKGVSNFYAVNGKSGKNQDRLQVYQKAHKPCPKCLNLIKKIRLGQRGTHFCSICQK